MFVKGLKKSISDQEIEAWMDEEIKKGLKEIRVVRNGKGQCKGIAYIEFESEEQCKRGVEKLGQKGI
jgi:hypothetical protein